MAIDKKKFSISPSTWMIDVLGHSGYTFNFAIADLIDNCISAHAKNIKIYFDLSSDEPFLCIADDGDGMNKKDLKNAAVIGFRDINASREIDDLGRYSTGLKSATRSFCDDVIICSKVRGSYVNSIEIDYKHIVNSQNWEAYELNQCEFENIINEHGTIVVCKSLNFSDNISLNENLFKKIDELEKSIGHIFGKFILDKKVRISLKVKGSNEIIIKGWNPFRVIENKSTKVVFKKDVIYKGENISFKIYILPTFENLSKIDREYMEGNGLINQEGFYIYRNNRLIKEGGWLDLTGISLDAKSIYSRIEVNIPSNLDKEFKINFSKNSLEIPEDLIPTFIEVAKKAKKESNQNYNYRKHPEIKRGTRKEQDRVWKSTKSDGALVLSINTEHPLIKELSKKIGVNELKKLCNLISKSLPISTIQAQTTTSISYTEAELFDLMEEMYNSLLSQGNDINTIKSKMASTEPFKDEIILLINFFEKKEDIK